jgi:hypothetical protein
MSRSPSIHDHHDVTDEDVQDFYGKIWEDIPLADQTPAPRAFRWKCCGAPGQNGIPHKCKGSAP